MNPEGEILRQRSVPKNPQGIAVNPDKGLLVISSADEKKLLLLSTETLEKTKEIPLAYQPKRIALDPGSDRAVVSAKEHWGSIEANMLLIVDLNTGALLQEMKFEEGILALAAGHDLDLAVALSREAIHLIDIQSGTLVSTLRPSIALSGGTKALAGGAEGDDYLGVDINPATRMAVVIGDGGFVLLDLATLTARDYPLSNDPVMKAVALDRFRNTFLGSYWKSSSPLVLERGVLEVQLPNPAPEIISLTPSEAARGEDSRTITLEGKGFINASEGYFSDRPLATTLLDNCHLELAHSQGTVFPGGPLSSDGFQSRASGGPVQQSGFRGQKPPALDHGPESGHGLGRDSKPFGRGLWFRIYRGDPFDRQGPGQSLYPAERHAAPDRPGSERPGNGRGPGGGGHQSRTRRRAVEHDVPFHREPASASIFDQSEGREGRRRLNSG